MALSEVSKVHNGHNPEETKSEIFQETGVTIYHAPTGSNFEIRAKVQQGEGKVFVNGIPIGELMESGRVKRIEELTQALKRDRFKALDIELQVGDSKLPEVLSPPVLAYAVTEVLTNLLGRLRLP